MAKNKLDLRGKNASRNEAGRETIQNSATFQAVVDKTKDMLRQEPSSPAAVTPSAEIDSVVEKIVGSAIADYKKIPTKSLVAAPIEWNYFSALSEEKKALMAESIFHNGLLQPIIVRSLDPAGNQYEILAGHHRAEAYSVLYTITGDPKYLEIEARVFPYQALTDAQAREIVEDTNFVQRGDLSARDKAACVYNKAKSLKERGEKGDVMTKVAEHFGINRSTAFSWKKLVDLIPDFADYFAKGNINIITASKIAGFPKQVQEELYRHLDLITNESMKKVKSKEAPEEIIPKLQKFLLPNAGNHYGHITAFKKEPDASFFIHVDKAPSDSMRPILVYLPNKKFDAFQKKYGEYIIGEKEN